MAPLRALSGLAKVARGSPRGEARTADLPPLGESAIIAEGKALYDAGRLAEALALIDVAIEKEPGSGVLHFARGATLFAWGRFREAHASFQRAQTAGLDDLDLDLHLGWMSVNLGRIDEAEGHFRRAVARDARSEPAYTSLANALETRGALKDCADEFATGLARWPESYDALLLLAICHSYLGDDEACIAAFRQAVALDPRRAKGWVNLGVALMDGGRSEEGFDALFRAHRIDLENGAGDSLVNLATALREARRIDEALALLEENLAQNPDPRLHWLRSVLLLELGPDQEGWTQHEFRWMKEPLVSQRRALPGPLWGGQDLRGRTILVNAEQGIGDTIQFIRYARLLKSLGARVVYDPFRDLGEIARDFHDVDDAPIDQPLPQFDFRIPLLGIPRVLGTVRDSIPAHVPYVDVQPEYRRKWAERIRGESRLKVGVVWAGNAKHVRDRMRSIPLASLVALGEVEKIALYSLQKRLGAEAEIAASGLDIVDLGRDFANFRDTAAAISLLDLVISVDTSVAHLAGALGRPTWILVAEPSDWRWGLESDRTPWYPSMRIFRQRERNDWGPVIAGLVAALAEFARSHQAEVRGGAARGDDAKMVETAQPRSTTPGTSDGVRVPDPAATVRRLVAAPFCGVDETRYGIVQWPPGSDLSTSVSYYGEWRQAELDLIGRFVKPGSWIVEECCGPGTATLVLARAAGEAGHVIAYEPDRVLGQIARQNLAANRIGNVTLLARRLEGKTAPAATGNAARGLSSDSLDDLRLARLDWIRLNSGPSAAAILAGGTATLWRLRPWVFVVTQSEADEDAAARVLRDHAYQCRRFRAPLFNSANYNRRTEDLFDGRIAMGLFCVPEEVEIDVALEHCTPIDPT